MNTPPHPRTVTGESAVCDPAVRRWAIVSIALLALVSWTGFVLFETGHDLLLLMFAGVAAVLAAHIKLYRALREDIVMDPEANARFLRRFWFGPLAALELLFFIFSRPGSRSREQ